MGDNIQDVQLKLCHNATVMLEWFQSNYMQANPSKFQLIIFSKDTLACELKINEGTIIHSQPTVKLLGVNIDDKLSFDDHVTLLCEKAHKKIIVSARVSTSLDSRSYSIPFILSNFSYCTSVWGFCS